jgi:hypothetical protein
MAIVNESIRGKSGKNWISYYYDGRTADGRRKEIPLGTDLDQAKVEWARLERKAPPKPNHLMGYVFDRYEKEIIPGKPVRTPSDNRKELKQLRRAFESAPIESITPQVVAQYRDARTAKVRANREIALSLTPLPLRVIGALPTKPTLALACAATRKSRATITLVRLCGTLCTPSPYRSSRMLWIWPT